LSSRIDAATLLAYRRTEYRVDAGWSIRIDQPSGELAAWHGRHGASGSAFVSAVNPRSRLLEDEDNRRRHLDLRAWLEERGLAYLAGAGVDPEGSWPAEPGFLIAGLGQDAAARLGRRYDQNAVVWSGADAVPRLLLLR